NWATSTGNSFNFASGKAVTLTGDTQLTTPSDSSITIGGTIDGAYNLILNSPTVTLNGVIGGTTPLASFTIPTISSGSITLGNNISTNNGNITLSNPASLSNDVILSAGTGNITFSGAISANSHGLTLNSSGNTILNDITNITNLVTDAGGTTYIASGNIDNSAIP